MLTAAQRDKGVSQVPVRKKRERERKLSEKISKLRKNIKPQCESHTESNQVKSKQNHTKVQNGSQNHLPDARWGLSIYPPLVEEVNPSDIWSALVWDQRAPRTLEKMLKQRGKTCSPCCRWDAVTAGELT